MLIERTDMRSDSGSEPALEVRYSGTPYCPGSPSISRDDDVHANPDRFVGEDMVVTEKLGGGNTLLPAGKVYARNGSAPSDTKKHETFKDRCAGCSEHRQTP